MRLPLVFGHLGSQLCQHLIRHSGPGKFRFIRKSVFCKRLRKVFPAFALLPGKIPAGTTFVGNDGKTYTAGTTPGGDRLSLLENATRNASKELTTGKLTVTGNSLEAAIGSVQYEDAGDMTFNGGIITTYARGAGNQYAYTASIGGGAGGSGGKMTFNGGVIETWTSYHGASIGGGGWATCSEANAYQFADTLGNNLVQTSQGSPHTVPAASKTCAGDIYINGGVLKPHGDMHGNAIGQGCCSWNDSWRLCNSTRW